MCLCDFVAQLGGGGGVETKNFKAESWMARIVDDEIKGHELGS